MPTQKTVPLRSSKGGSSREGSVSEPELTLVRHTELEEFVSGHSRVSAFEASTDLAESPWREIEEGHCLEYPIFCN